MNILHLSDIHFSDSITSNALNSEIEELSSAINNWKTDNNQELEYIFVSGDIASKGLKEDYEIADMFFSQLLDKIGLDKKQIFFVPGNHDVCWGNICESEIHYKQKLYNDNLAENDIYTLKTEIYQKKTNICYPKFVNYDQFIKKYTIKSNIHLKDSLFYYVHKIENYYIIGLNTAMFCGQNDIDHKFFFVEEQLKEIEKEINSNNNVLLLMHHSFSFLHRIENEYFKKFIGRQSKNLIFYGHYHDNTYNRQEVKCGKWINELREGAFLANDTSLRSFSIYMVDFINNNFEQFKYKRTTETLGWINESKVTNFISYPTLEEIQNGKYATNISKIASTNYDEKALFIFIFGTLSEQFKSLTEIYSYLENLFMQNNNKFLQIAEKTFERFNNTPLLCILKNYLVKIIVLYSNNDLNIENCKLLKNSTFLINLFNTLNIVISGFKEYPLEKIEYWLDFIDKYMNIVPQNSRIVISNILRQSLIKINTLENEVSDEK